MMTGDELKRIRTANRLSQAQFGELVDIHRVTISEWERGIGKISVAVEIIARTLDAHPELLPEMERWRGMREMGGANA
jgi:transcriptional regulator with XRE-family HTH domain